ncbi:MAG: DNA methyltransferase [Acidobacteria bacterium]|nr:DNA methyltransferase [Acidobacteriota bacterium]
MTVDDLVRHVRDFRWDGRATVETVTAARLADGRAIEVPTFVNEFWTSRQRVAHSLHEVSYRACFKPQLPRFFIERLTEPGAVVYDPFAGRGTTPLEAALAGRVPIACDVNPLTAVLLAPRLAPPSVAAVRTRLQAIHLDAHVDVPRDLHVFFHLDTLREIAALRAYLLDRERSGALDDVDRWIRMVAVNRLTGHSPGFFSVYTLPPNQATSVVAQRKINETRQQIPPRRDVKAIILKKSKALVADLEVNQVRIRPLLGDAAPDGRQTLAKVAGAARLVTAEAHHTPTIASSSVDLIVTSPPFLTVVNYKLDNWLRCWFCGIDPDGVRITSLHGVDEWQAAMSRVFSELHRVLKPGACVAFEVGEVRRGSVRLEEAVIPAGALAGLEPVFVLINAQRFTKTAAVWGVANNRLGTNTNRIVVFRKP